MKEEKLRQMEELDARIEKINYDLAGLESRKKEMEENKFEKQQKIEKLEEEKKSILAKTDKMNRLQKIIYIAFASKNDLKQVDLINAKIAEHRNEKDNIQNKIDIQNGLYTETIKEKEKYIEQRKKLYNENTKEQQGKNQETIKDTAHIKDLVEIHRITKKYEKSDIMKALRMIIESKVNQIIGTNENNRSIEKREQTEEWEME